MTPILAVLYNRTSHHHMYNNEKNNNQSTHFQHYLEYKIKTKKQQKKYIYVQSIYKRSSVKYIFYILMSNCSWLFNQMN